MGIIGIIGMIRIMGIVGINGIMYIYIYIKCFSRCCASGSAGARYFSFVPFKVRLFRGLHFAFWVVHVFSLIWR